MSEGNGCFCNKAGPCQPGGLGCPKRVATPCDSCSMAARVLDQERTIDGLRSEVQAQAVVMAKKDEALRVLIEKAAEHVGCQQPCEWNRLTIAREFASKALSLTTTKAERVHAALMECYEVAKTICDPRLNVAVEKVQRELGKEG